MKTKKTPAPRRSGTVTATREARALACARRAIDELSDDPETLRLFIGMVALLGERSLRGF